jgi:hypothetical protein
MRNALRHLLLLGPFAVSCAVGQDAGIDSPPSRPIHDAGSDARAPIVPPASSADASHGSGSNGMIGSPAAPASADAGAPAACAAETRKAETLPLDMFIMMDQSSSMSQSVNGGVQWDLVVTALSQFVMDPGSAGMGVGIQYFGLDAGGFDWFGLVDSTSCNAADYANPDVPISVLPSGANAVLDSLHRHGPNGQTPTTPALQGAIQYAAAWANQHPTHRVVVVLATDGLPSECQSTIDEVAQVAKSGAEGTPKIPTHVVGVGSAVTNLDLVAASGGTGRALMVDTSQDTAKNFLAAMNAVRNAALLPCQFTIPSPKAGDTLDLDKVNIAYTPGSGADAGRATTIPQVPDGAACDPGQGGWFYDDPKAPTAMNLCDATCRAVAGDTMGRVDVLVGCKTLTVIR